MNKISDCLGREIKVVSLTNEDYLKAFVYLQRVHKNWLDGYLYSGPMREEIGEFLGGISAR